MVDGSIDIKNPKSGSHGSIWIHLIIYQILIPTCLHIYMYIWCRWCFSYKIMVDGRIDNKNQKFRSHGSIWIDLIIYQIWISTCISIYIYIYIYICIYDVDNRSHMKLWSTSLLILRIRNPDPIGKYEVHLIIY